MFQPSGDAGFPNHEPYGCWYHWGKQGSSEVIEHSDFGEVWDPEYSENLLEKWEWYPEYSEKFSENLLEKWE